MSEPAKTGTRFTPGPWSKDPLATAIYASNPYGHGDMKVLDIRGWGHLTGTGACHLDEEAAIAIQHANGSLASAAPDLYKACKAFLQQFNHDLTHDQCAVFDDIARAVAKAEGREP